MRRNLFAWIVDTDPDRTRSVYQRVEGGASRRCGCPDCRNFDAARPDHYPNTLRELLASVAIDPCKEALVSLVTPLESNQRLYAGSYIFCGAMLAGRPRRGFPFITERVDVFEELAPQAHVALRPLKNPEGAWTEHPCVRLEFLVVLPWVLGERSVPAVNLGESRNNSLS